MNKKKIIIGSRGSKLAMLYAKNVRKNILSENSDLNDNSIEMKLIKTSGDIYNNKSIPYNISNSRFSLTSFNVILSTSIKN